MDRYARTGDRAAFEELFRRYAPRLLAYLRRSGLPGAAAHDAAQQVFLQLHRARADYRAGAPVRPWMFTIAANVRRDVARRAQRRPEAELERAPEPASPAAASTPEDRVVRRALDRLPPEQRDVLVLHYYEGLSMGEVAEVLGATRAAVKVRAHRAYLTLRDLLARATPTPGAHPRTHKP